MKRLIFVNGPMGVGKSTVCRELQKLLAPCAYLDGDWCWDLVPFTVTEETKELVLGNAAHLLRSFLDCSAVETVLFAWVLPKREIIDELLSRIGGGAEFRLFTLTAGEQTLAARLEADVREGRREAGVIARALSYIPLYAADMGGVRIGTDALAAADVARTIADMVRPGGRK